MGNCLIPDKIIVIGDEMEDMNLTMTEDGLWFINRPSMKALKKKEINNSLWNMVGV